MLEGRACTATDGKGQGVGLLFFSPLFRYLAGFFCVCACCLSRPALRGAPPDGFSHPPCVLVRGGRTGGRRRRGEWGAHPQTVGSGLSHHFFSSHVDARGQPRKGAAWSPVLEASPRTSQPPVRRPLGGCVLHKPLAAPPPCRGRGRRDGGGGVHRKAQRRAAATLPARGGQVEPHAISARQRGPTLLPPRSASTLARPPTQSAWQVRLATLTCQPLPPP